MLIKDNIFDFSEFKSFYTKMKWMKLPRKLGVNHQDFFYMGTYDDDKKSVKITIRPSYIMQITESFKNKDKSGRDVDENFKGETYSFGTTLEIKIDDSVLDKIKEVAQEKPMSNLQKVSWV